MSGKPTVASGAKTSGLSDLDKIIIHGGPDGLIFELNGERKTLKAILEPYSGFITSLTCMSSFPTSTLININENNDINSVLTLAANLGDQEAANYLQQKKAATTTTIVSNPAGTSTPSATGGTTTTVAGAKRGAHSPATRTTRPRTATARRKITVIFNPAIKPIMTEAHNNGVDMKELNLKMNSLQSFFKNPKYQNKDPDTAVVDITT